MKYILSWCAAIALIMTLPGCSRLVDWAKERFNQGDKACCDSSVPRCYIRSITVYDQFYTRGRFDVMWLSDEVRTAYAHVYNTKHGRSDDKKNSFLRRQRAENKHFIVFYVLCPASYLLGDPMSNWTLVLQIGDQYFDPVEVKAFDLEPEYKVFFGKCFNRFKVATRVKFEAKDDEGELLLDDFVKEIALHIRSCEKNIVFCWDVV